MSSFISFKVMWKTTVTFFICLASAISADEPVGPYRELGSTVVISAGPVTGKVTSITWKHGDDIAVEWFGDEVSCFRQFKDRCELDTTTGNLTIRGVTREHSGKYTPEISNTERGSKEIRVIAPVPKPTVTTRCNDDKTYCVLTCEGNITHAGPVEYFWIRNDREVPGNKELKITEEDKETEFGCSLKNPVSHKRSEMVDNPLISGNGINAGVIAGVVVVVLLLLLLIGIFVCRCTQKGRELFNPVWNRCQRIIGGIRGRAEPDPERGVNTPLNPAANGTEVAAADKGAEKPGSEQNGEAAKLDQTPNVTLDTTTETAHLNDSATEAAAAGGEPVVGTGNPGSERSGETSKQDWPPTETPAASAEKTAEQLDLDQKSDGP